MKSTHPDPSFWLTNSSQMQQVLIDLSMEPQQGEGTHMVKRDGTHNLFIKVYSVTFKGEVATVIYRAPQLVLAWGDKTYDHSMEKHKSWRKPQWDNLGPMVVMKVTTKSRLVFQRGEYEETEHESECYLCYYFFNRDAI